MLSKLKCIVCGNHGDLEHLASLALVVGDPDVLQEGDFEELLELYALAVVLSFNRSLEDKQALGKVKQALKTLLVFKELDFWCRDNLENGMDQSSFDLSNAKLTDLPETSIPSLLHRNRLIELTEHIGMHGAQVIQHLGQRHLSLMSQEPTLHDLICERNLSTLE